MKTLIKFPQALGLACALFAGAAQASVTIGGTRVIYPLDQREVTVKLDNDSKAASLVQVWIDDGKPGAAPGDAKVPFVVTPPIFRMEPHKAQTLRVIYTGDALPQDHESVFFLNVLDIPPKADGTDANTLQFAFRTRIKVFVRPDKLADSPEEAPGKLSWKLVPAPNGESGQALSVRNPTPYHVSFSEFEVDGGGQTFKNEQGGMVAPQGTTVLTVPGLEGVGNGAKVRFTAISDYAAALPGEAPLAK